VDAVAGNGFTVDIDFNIGLTDDAVGNHRRRFDRRDFLEKLLNLQADDVESVQVQRRVFEESQGSLLYAVSLADSIAEVRQRKREFERLPTVSHVEDLAANLPQYAWEETELLVQGIRAKLSDIPDFSRQFPRQFRRLNPKSIGRALEDLLRALYERTTTRSQSAAIALDGALDALSDKQLDAQVEFLAGFQHAMLTALNSEFAAIAASADPEPVMPEDFPEALRERFVSDDGQWLLRVFPAEQVWDEEPLAQFVSDVRTVDPEATGTPLQNHEAARQIRDSYFEAAIYAFAVIWLVLLVDTVDRGPLLIGLVAPLALIGLTVVALPQPQLLLTPFQMLGLYLAMVTAIVLIFDFASVRSALLTLVPPIGGGLLMFGILGLGGIDLNPANLIVLPLILGIGVDDGVHVIHDFRLQQEGEYRTSSSTINAIMLTSLTSMIGFGSMLLAAHRGLGSCLFVSLVTLPAMLTLVSRRALAGELTETDGSDAADVVPFEDRRETAG